QLLERFLIEQQQAADVSLLGLGKARAILAQNILQLGFDFALRLGRQFRAGRRIALGSKPVRKQSSPGSGYGRSASELAAGDSIRFRHDGLVDSKSERTRLR